MKARPVIMVLAMLAVFGLFSSGATAQETNIMGKLRSDMKAATSRQEASKVLAGFEAEQIKYLEELAKRYYPQRVQDKLLEELHGREPNNDQQFIDTEIAALWKETREHGCRLSVGEGIYFPILDYEQLVQYRPYVTADMREYIAIMAVESGEKAWEDGGLAISYEKALDRALLQEAFLIKYKSAAFANVEEVRSRYKDYVSSLVLGTKHTSHFDWKTKKIRDISRDFFGRVSQQNSSGSLLLQKLQGLSIVIRNNNYQQTEEVFQYQRTIIDNIGHSVE